MKKLFTLIMMLCAVTAMSAQNQHSWPTGEYKSLGTGSMTDAMLTELHQYLPVTYDVEIQQSVEDPNFYRVIAPYGQAFADAMKAVNNVTLKPGQYDSEGVKVLDIDATDPEDVYFAKTMTGCTWHEEDGELYIGIPQSAKVWFRDGVFGAPMRGVAVGDNGGAVAMNVSQQFRIALPGYEKDFELTLTPKSQCLTTREFVGEIKVGRDIAKVMYATVPNLQEDEMKTYVDNVALDGGEFKVRGEFSYEMANYYKETLIVVGLDKNGEPVAHDWTSYYYIDDDKDNWLDAGEVEFHEALLQMFLNIGPQTVKCQLQRHAERPSYLRLVNPYRAHTHWYTGTHDTHNDHNHYIYINAEYPDCIFIEESPLCIDFGYGMVRIWSMVGYFIGAGYDIEEAAELELGAVFDDDTKLMTFPEEALSLSMMKHDNADWYSDNNAETYIQFPQNFDINGVDTITVDEDSSNAPVSYYNLQGQRIDNPASGQLVIRRQGSKATKQITR